MPKAELKTKKNTASVKTFLQSVMDTQMREDCNTVAELMSSITKSNPKMWGATIVGFGEYHYKYESGREGDWFLCGFSPRKQALTLYLMGGLESQKDLLEKLGKFKIGKSCLYIKRLADVDMKVLKALIQNGVKNPMGKA
ncbi:MAG: DUF1801 domain-containing protein [Cyclobacteriaceae bacterium]|nr:DUF1801 domain-containing protein [Cyclobacteriaceae bacterium]